MNHWAYLAVHDAAALLAGAYLVTHDCPWWGALCFAMAATTTVSEVRQKAKQP